MSELAFFFDHDGNNDDIVSLILLGCIPTIPEILGIGVVPADCFLEPALISTRLCVEAFLKAGDARFASTRIGVGVTEGVHPFPDSWRALSHGISASLQKEFPSSIVESCRNIQQDATGPEVLLYSLQRCQAEQKKMRLLFTGPLTNLAAILSDESSRLLAEEVIERLFWMGGAVDAPGNVIDQVGVDGTAEWNSYWDPPSADIVFRSSIPITLISLDSTDQLPLTEDFVSRLRVRSSSFWAQMSAQIWQESLSFSELMLWDTFSTLVSAWPERFPTEDIKLSIVLDGPSEGRTIRSEDGRVIQVVKPVEPEMVYSMLLEIFN